MKKIKNLLLLWLSIISFVLISGWISYWLTVNQVIDNAIGYIKKMIFTTDGTENGEAKVLAPKYNLALHYPLLSMTGFMTIATVPGAILKDCEKIFK